MPVAALADTPAFDRPGISFATTTLPASTFAWEQGVPDFARDRAGGVTTTDWSADTTIRAGITDRVEVQLGTALFNGERVQGGGIARSDTGYGDSSVALKVALPSRVQRFSWAAIGKVTFASGQPPFTAGEDQYSLATTLGWQVSDRVSRAFLVGDSRADGVDTWTYSPLASVALSPRWAAFAEAGRTRQDGAPDDDVAGGGVTFMATPVVQLDAWADFGLTGASTDLQGGLGVSVWFR